MSQSLSKEEFMARFWKTVLLLLLGGAASSADYGQQREVERPFGGVVDFLSPQEADPILQHSKEVYVKNGCAYCHGVDLNVRNGEAADLMHSAIVGADLKGNLLGPLLRNGIPQTAKLSPMPQYKDLSDKNIEDLTQWIHYARQQGRFKELKVSDGTAGNPVAGKAEFQQACSSCHSVANLAEAVRRYTPAELRVRMLEPPTFISVKSFKLSELHNEIKQQGQQRHAAFLENATKGSVSNMVAYLQTLK